MPKPMTSLLKVAVLFSSLTTVAISQGKFSMLDISQGMRISFCWMANCKTIYCCVMRQRILVS